MTQFIQLHLLTSYPPSNLNRDDLGRPKTAIMGGTTRLRVSSQSLKRAWRTSDAFGEALAGHIGTRTKEIGRVAFEILNGKMKEGDAKDAAIAIAGVFGKMQTREGKGLDTEQLVHFSPEERAAVEALAKTLADENRQPTDDELMLLRGKNRAADIALFGRMVAANTKHNVDAAAQVAHAITVHEIAVEEDYFSAVDDLNRRGTEREDGVADAGAGHIGEHEFGAGVYYLYVCINRDLLVENLSGDEGLAETTLRALVEAACTIAPTGKQASFASRAWASFVLAEKGEAQPRSLSVAFLEAVGEGNYLSTAIRALTETRAKMNDAYGVQGVEELVFNPHEGSGTFEELLNFAASR